MTIDGRLYIGSESVVVLGCYVFACEDFEGNMDVRPVYFYGKREGEVF